MMQQIIFTVKTDNGLSLILLLYIGDFLLIDLFFIACLMRKFNFSAFQKKYQNLGALF
jgi:hypothetical protein